jgi:tRNA1Val (adenine37-N6)-methyltransferase
LLRGDLRDRSIVEEHAPFDLVLGSPPYFPPGTAVAASHEQAVGARIETRGDVLDYARAAASALGPGGVFAFVFPAAQGDRVAAALAGHALVLVRRRDVVFREGDRALIALFAASRAADVPSTFEAAVENPLTIRMRDGSVSTEYSAIRMSFGFPPGNVPGTTAT